MIILSKVLLISAALVLTGCMSTTKYLTNTQFVVLTPDTVPTPNPPKLSKYRANEPMDSEYNFKTFQYNHLQMVDYITLLHRNIRYYELQITDLKEQKDSIENPDKKDDTTKKVSDNNN